MNWLYSTAFRSMRYAQGICIDFTVLFFYSPSPTPQHTHAKKKKKKKKEREKKKDGDVTICVNGQISAYWVLQESHHLSLNFVSN